MKKWLTGVTIVLMAVSLVVCMPTTERQKKETTAATAAKSQEDMALPSTGEASDRVPDPNAMPVAAISIHHDGGGSLVQNVDLLDTGRLDAQLLIDKLTEYDVLTDSTKVLSPDVEGKDGNAVEALDLSQAESAEGCPDKMFLIEIGSIFTENFELSKLKLKVNGANYEGDDIKQRDSDYLTYNADYESVE